MPATNRNAEIIAHLAKGEIHREIADRFGISRQRIGQLKQENREVIHELQEQYRLRVFQKAIPRLENMVGALCDSVEDPENRNQPQAMRALNETLGLSGKGAHLHWGDNHLNVETVNVDARRIVLAQTPEERAEKLRTLRERLG